MSFYPKAISHPGPWDKQGYGPALMTNACIALVLHDAGGGLAQTLAELASTARKSWTHTVAVNGDVYEHYRPDAVTWHSGSMFWNLRAPGIEHERIYLPAERRYSAAPVSGAQLEASVALVEWYGREFDIPLVRPAGLKEHNEIVDTACPSGRIQWDAYTEASMADLEELRTAIGTLAAAQAGQIKAVEDTQRFIGRATALLSTGDEADRALAERELRYLFAIAHLPFPSA